MLLLQEAAHGAAAAAEGHGFAPVLPWLIVALPLLGFVLNGLLSVVAARRALPALPPVGDPYYDHAHDDHGHAAAAAHAPARALAAVGAGDDASSSGLEAEPHLDLSPSDRGHGAHDDHGHDQHEADEHLPAGPKPFTHTLPSFIAPGVLIAAFVLAVLNFLGMKDAGEHARTAIVDGWSWIRSPS
jgi:NADH-quinone oxidoreductase subunit L